MSLRSLYEELGSPPAGEERGRTEMTFVATETIDNDRATDSRESRLLHAASAISPPDPGRTEQTAAKETIDRDRHPLAMGGHLTEGSLYEAVSSSAQGSDRGRTELTKVKGETVDRDHHGLGQARQLSGGNDLYVALSDRVPCGDSDRGRTEITTATETIDWDRPPRAFGP